MPRKTPPSYFPRLVSDLFREDELHCSATELLCQNRRHSLCFLFCLVWLFFSQTAPHYFVGRCQSVHCIIPVLRLSKVFFRAWRISPPLNISTPSSCASKSNTTLNGVLCDKRGTPVTSGFFVFCMPSINPSVHPSWTTPSIRKEPTQTQGEHANSTQKGPGLELNWGPPCCEANQLVFSFFLLNIHISSVALIKDNVQELQNGFISVRGPNNVNNVGSDSQRFLSPYKHCI